MNGWLVVTGTWNLWLSIYWECHHPNWLFLFQRGWNHQPGNYCFFFWIVWMVCQFLVRYRLAVSWLNFLGSSSVFGQNVDTTKKRAISGNPCSRWWLQVRFYTFVNFRRNLPLLLSDITSAGESGLPAVPEFRGYMRQAVNFDADPSEQSFVYSGLCLEQ